MPGCISEASSDAVGRRGELRPCSASNRHGLSAIHPHGCLHAFRVPDDWFEFCCNCRHPSAGLVVERSSEQRRDRIQFPSRRTPRTHPATRANLIPEPAHERNERLGVAAPRSSTRSERSLYMSVLFVPLGPYDSLGTNPAISDGVASSALATMSKYLDSDRFVRSSLRITSARLFKMIARCLASIFRPTPER